MKTLARLKLYIYLKWHITLRVIHNQLYNCTSKRSINFFSSALWAKERKKYITLLNTQNDSKVM